MSNRASITTTKFTNIKSGESTLGFRAYDDYEQMYDNTWDEMPDGDMDVLAKVLKESDCKEMTGIIDFIVENKKGIEINGTWYDWEDIKETVEKYFG